MNLLPNYSHCYVETSAERHPLAGHILGRLDGSTRVAVRHYQDVFARPGQNFRLQKASAKIVLATKRGRLLYPTPPVVQGGGLPGEHTGLHYCAQVLNCPYDCRYCYLQGLYPSANLVVFVNTADYFEAVRAELARRPERAGPFRLAVSYDADLLALEPLVPLCREWVEFARATPGLEVEIRTKSTRYSALRDLEPHPGVVLAWTVSPAAVARDHERLAPPPERRLASAAEAARDGWKVRLCFDPVLRVPGWREHYRGAVAEALAAVPPALIHDVHVGVFRLGADLFKRVQKQHPNAPLFRHPYTGEGGVVTYPQTERAELTGHLVALLGAALPPHQIISWT